MIFNKPFTEDYLSELGFFHDSKQIGHSGNSAELEWDGKKFSIEEQKYRLWQVGASTHGAFFQLVVKFVVNSELINIHVYAGEDPVGSFAFTLYYGECKTEKEFKGLMKQYKMWDMIINNRAANVAANVNINNITDEF